MRYLELNNEVMLHDDKGVLQFGKDKEAARAYFLDYVNKNIVSFLTLKEKINYMISQENNYYESWLLEKYDHGSLKRIFKAAYAHKFRFPSFMSAFKFYNDYALRTNDKKKFLERYEDRVVLNALFFAQGDESKAIRQVNQMMRQIGQPATPTFLNAGRARRGELVSCFLTEVGDSLNNINMAESTSKQLSKIGGGVSLYLSDIRAKGEAINGVEDATKGVVGVMKGLDHAFRYADQMGQRQGAGAVYLDILHADIVDFLETKKITADEDFRVKTLSIGVVIPDKFIELAHANKKVHLFYPHSIFKEYGIRFSEINWDEMYDKLVENPRIRKDTMDARALLEKLAVMRIESGYPYIMYTDNVNNVHNLEGRVKMSNLCTEILQLTVQSEYTDYGEPDDIGIDVSCNLYSLNILNLMKYKDIQEAVYLATDALTVVSEESSIKNAPGVKKGNELMRSIGLGAMNLHGYLANVGVAYDSETTVEFSHTLFSTINYYSLKRSMEIAREKNSKFYGFEKSKYATGEYFDKYLEYDFSPQTDKVKEMFEGHYIPTLEDWEQLKKDVMQYGLYHAYRLAIAPTGSISYVQSATASVMPIMERIEERTYGNSKTYYPMPGLSPSTWFLYKEAYDMDMRKVVDVVAAIQEHVDQGISFTYFIKDTATTRDITNIDLYAHSQGIKTSYYARTKDTSNAMCVSCAV